MFLRHINILLSSSKKWIIFNFLFFFLLLLSLLTNFLSLLIKLARHLEASETFRFSQAPYILVLANPVGHQLLLDLYFDSSLLFVEHCEWETISGLEDRGRKRKSPETYLCYG
jgi:hypothetical protein